MAAPFRLSDAQLKAVMQVAEPLDPSKRTLLLERTAANLRCSGSHQPTDDDVRRALDRAVQGLQQRVHGPPAPMQVGFWR